MVKKKIKDFTLGEMANICSKLACNKCPFHIKTGCCPIGYYREAFSYSDKALLDKEIEVD